MLLRRGSYLLQCVKGGIVDPSFNLGKALHIDGNFPYHIRDCLHFPTYTNTLTGVGSLAAPAFTVQAADDTLVYWSMWEATEIGRAHV